MRITAPDGTVLDGAYPTGGRWRGYRDHALAVPREVFDRVLVERARALPVDVRERHRVTALLRDGDRVVGVQAEDEDGARVDVGARLVVGADGRASVVARALGLLRPHRLQRLALIRYVSGVEGLHDRGEIYVDPPDYSILNPVAPGLVNLSLVVPLAHARPYGRRMAAFFEARIKQLRHLPARVAGMRAEGPLRVMGPLAYRVREPRVGGVLLAGDAAGFYDPFTGEGVFTALRSAELAADTIVRALRTHDVSAAALDAYERARRAAFDGKARVTRALQTVISHRRLATWVCRRLARRPAALDALLGVVGDYVPPRALPGALSAALGFRTPR
jgi:flavin-dependent dehydrogenase